LSINKFNIVELSNRDPMRFAVTLRNDTSETKNIFSMTHDFYRNKGINKRLKDVILAAFKFLIAREPQKMILLKFDLTEIGVYFSEFKSELSTYL